MRTPFYKNIKKLQKQTKIIIATVTLQTYLLNFVSHDVEGVTQPT